MKKAGDRVLFGFASDMIWCDQEGEAVIDLEKIVHHSCAIDFDTLRIGSSCGNYFNISAVWIDDTMRMGPGPIPGEFFASGSFFRFGVGRKKIRIVLHNVSAVQCRCFGAIEGTVIEQISV